jgi:hypothetical protein
MLDLLNLSLAKLCLVSFIAVAEALRMFHESIRASSWPLTKVSLMYPWLDNPGEIMEKFPNRSEFGSVPISNGCVSIRHHSHDVKTN